MIDIKDQKIGYREVVPKTSIEIDDAKLDAVRALLGTRSKRDTVDAALDDVIGRHLRQDFVDRLTRMDGLDLNDPAVMADAWR